MSDDRLAIPLNDLEDFAGMLGSITQRMNGTKTLFHEFEEDLGDGSVVDALSHFEHNWKDGRGDIDKQLSGLEKMAATVVHEIRKVDADLAKQLEKALHQEDGHTGNGTGGGSTVKNSGGSKKEKEQ